MRIERWHSSNAPRWEWSTSTIPPWAERPSCPLEVGRRPESANAKWRKRAPNFLLSSRPCSSTTQVSLVSRRFIDHGRPPAKNLRRLHRSEPPQAARVSGGSEDGDCPPRRRQAASGREDRRRLARQQLGQGSDPTLLCDFRDESDGGRAL